ncbi:MAG: 1-(5-phosphoribosyl)-5-[(5-phosphoribosylamino)methylideneamino]imidazole-4-carboxamide isomerase [Acidimicrobiales bacterium]|nr:1-(5-phosphoribosyl)-5-[(5-phosphoribosylamino)methylideneamino]imidazole-4-carboxamide isomerase [Acidimicrobiales bacterium]
MDLYPAIDLRGGRCVRLYQGDYARETVYADDPVAQARAFADAGAPWIHVVDLDGARTGVPAHVEQISAIAAAVDVPVQTGGGIRDEAAAERLFAGGVARVVLGTVALERPELVAALAARHPVAVGLDARAGDVAVRGWEEASGRRLLDVAHEFESVGIAALVVTDIGRDGTLEGPDLEGLAAVLAATSVEVVASGGVGALGDLERLAALEAGGRSLGGAIVGRALYEGAFSLEAALAAAKGR